MLSLFTTRQEFQKKDAGIGWAGPIKTLTGPTRGYLKVCKGSFWLLRFDYGWNSPQGEGLRLPARVLGAGLIPYTGSGIPSRKIL